MYSSFSAGNPPHNGASNLLVANGSIISSLKPCDLHSQTLGVEEGVVKSSVTLAKSTCCYCKNEVSGSKSIQLSYKVIDHTNSQGRI